MKLLLDQGVARTAAAELRSAGFDVVHVGEVGLAQAPDQLLLTYARDEGRVIDAGRGLPHPACTLERSVAVSRRLRIQGLRGKDVAAVEKDVLVLCDADLRAGAMISVEASNVRVRRLPFVP